MRRSTCVAAILFFVCLGSAQQAEEGIPAGWKVRLDKPGEAAPVKFWTMPPGWHVTSGPACILYDPSNTARGQYRVHSESFLFDPGQRLEGFGIFIGGKNLDAENQSYSYFLIRRDGRFLVKQRDAGHTREIVPWTEHPAIVRHPGGQKTAKNVLAIEVGPESVDFFVNDQKVTSLPASRLTSEGIAGLRINHNVNLHVTSLTITPK